MDYPPSGYDRRQALAWAFYDWGNSAFATTVMAAFFPIFLGNYWIGDSGVDSTFILGNANGIGSLIVVILAPVIGAIADRMGARKRYLASLAFMGALMTALMFVVGRGDWRLAVVLYVLGLVGFAGGNVFYDSLLVAVAREDKRDLISSLGYALGYIGGALLFAVQVFMTLKPQLFGFSGPQAAVRTAFLMTAVWWALFTLPLLLWVKEPRVRAPMKGWPAVRAGFVELRHTIGHVRALRPVVLFLVAYWLYIDGVDTIVVMAVDFGRRLGFGTTPLIQALLITNLIGFPATLLYAKLAGRLGAKSGVLIGLGVYSVTTVSAYFITQVWQFYALAAVIGLVQGGVQALSRSLYSRLIPQQKAAEFFGFYNMLGKFAAVLGPIMMGWASALTGSPRLAILSILILFIAGALCLTRVPAGSRQSAG